MSQVKVLIKDTANTNYWTGSTWTSSENWILATGQGNWNYGTMPAWSSGTVYLVQSKAYDNASNTETPLEGNSFTYDTTSPSSYATYPTNSTILKALATISGAATDNATGVSNVKVSIRQNSDTAYWSGSDWQVVSEIWKNATGGTSWNIGGATYTTNTTYQIRTKATDGAGVIETAGTGVSFTYDDVSPSSIVTSPSNSKKTSSLPTISGTASDITSSVTGVKISIKNNNTTNWWTGSNWGVAEIFLDASGTANWSYTSPTWSTGNVYFIRAKAFDTPKMKKHRNREFIYL